LFHSTSSYVSSAENEIGAATKSGFLKSKDTNE